MISLISVILPVYKTADCLLELHERLAATLGALPYDFELVMIDDGSPDAAWPMLRALAARDRRVKALRLSRNFGQQAAIAAGFAHASGDAIVLMDADLQNRPEEIPCLLARLQEEDVDFVYTVKRDPEPKKFFTQLTSRMYHAAYARLTRTHLPDNVTTLTAFTRRALDAMLAFPERNVLYGNLLFFVGFDHAIVPVRHDERPRGRSSYSFRKRLSLGVNSIISYTDLPQRVMLNLGGLIIAGTVIYSIVLVLVRFFLPRRSLVPGLTLIQLTLTGILGVLMLSLGIIGIYVFQIYQEVLGRPRYLVAQRVNLDAAARAPLARAAAAAGEGRPEPIARPDPGHRGSHDV